MTCVRQQRQRVLRQSYGGFDAHEKQVEDDAEDEDAIHGGGHDMMMVVTMMVMVVFVMMFVMMCHSYFVFIVAFTLQS
jgi:hypothetical protein